MDVILVRIYRVILLGDRNDGCIELVLLICLFKCLFFEKKNKKKGADGSKGEHIYREMVREDGRCRADFE